jgi:hypothetical protein
MISTSTVVNLHSHRATLDSGTWICPGVVSARWELLRELELHCHAGVDRHDQCSCFGRQLAPTRPSGARTGLTQSCQATRLRLKAHETAAGSTDHTDPALVPPLVAEMLRDLVESYNVFIAGDPQGRELDQICLGPLERRAAQAVVDAALPIVEAVHTSQALATTAAVQALTEQVEAARNAPAACHSRQGIPPVPRQYEHRRNRQGPRSLRPDLPCRIRPKTAHS